MFVDTVRATIEKHRMLRPGDRVLVGVSGGPDSLALLGVLVALREELMLYIRAAYVDHGLRPSEVRKEIALVKKVGHSWGVPVHTLCRSVRRSGGESLEAVARKIRYQALESLARRYRCHAIALGHTQDDQAETILMWLIRGTGTSGLAGIPPVREVVPGAILKIIRPLIHCSRAQVEAHLKTQGIHALKDSTNDSPRFFRNRIRRELIPWLEREFNPQLRRHLSQLAQILRSDLDWMNHVGMKEFRQVVRNGDGEIRLNRERLRRSPEALRRSVLRLAVARLQGNRDGFGVRHWQLLDELLLSGRVGALDLPHRIRAEVSHPKWLRLVASPSIWYTKKKKLFQKRR